MIESSADVTVSAHRVADELFAQHVGGFGYAAAGYRGHVHRVIALVGRQVTLDETTATLLGQAAFFHDAGIWLDDSFDYLPTSIERARRQLGGSDPVHTDLVVAMIEEHRRLRRARPDDPIVEAFRRADLTDISLGLIRSPGVTPAEYRSLTRRYPSAGFRRGLMVNFTTWAVRHPLRPLPMVRW